jgi:hypothetical protein
MGDYENAIRYILNNNIEGACVECGVERGDVEILWINELQKYNQVRDIYLFDTFSGLTAPDERDYGLLNGWTANDVNSCWEQHKIDDNTNGWCYCPFGDVRNRLLGTNYPEDKLHFIAGDVEDTLEDVKNIPEKIAILRLDTDWYKSTKIELEKLYDNVVPGGLIIMDDYYYWAGQKKAVDEFFTNLGVNYEVIQCSDKTGYIIKNCKTPFYYFYTPDYLYWHQALKNTLKDYFDVRSILLDTIDGLHDHHAVHHWIGCSEKVKLIIGCIRQNIGKRIVFSDATNYVNPNKVKELHSLVCNASSGMTFARNSQIDEINICFMTIDCTHETLQFWEDILGKIGPNDCDQYIINCAVKNPQFFEAHKIIARWPVDTSTWHSRDGDSFLVLKIFTPSGLCKKARDEFRYNIMKEYGYPILP